MAETLDSLQINVTANAQGAIKEIQDLTEAVGKLFKTRTRMDKFSEKLDKLSHSLEAFGQFTMPQGFDDFASSLGTLGKSLRSISLIDSTKLQAASDALKSFSEHVFTLNEKQISSLERYATAMEKLKGFKGITLKGLEEKAVSSINGMSSNINDLVDAYSRLNPDKYNPANWQPTVGGEDVIDVHEPKFYEAEETYWAAREMAIQNGINGVNDILKAGQDQIQEGLRTLCNPDVSGEDAMAAIKQVRKNVKAISDAARQAVKQDGSVTNPQDVVASALQGSSESAPQNWFNVKGAHINEFSRSLDTVQGKLISVGTWFEKLGAKGERYSKVRMPRFLQEIVGIAAPFVSAAGKLVKGLGDMTNAVRNFAREMSAAGTGGGLMAFLKIFSAGFGMVFGVVGSLVKGIIGIVQAIVPVVLSIIKTVISAIASAVKLVLSVISSAVKAIVGVISGIVRTIVSLVTGAIKLVIGAVTTVIKGIIAVIQGAIGLIVGAVKGVVSAVVSVITAVVPVVLRAVTGAVSLAIDGLKTLATGFGKAATAAGKFFLQFAFMPFSSMVEDIKSLASSLGGLVKRFTRVTAFRVFRSAISNIGNALKEGRDNLYEFSAATKKVYSAKYAKTMDSFATSNLTFKNSLAAAVAPIYNALIPAINTAVSAIVTLVNAVNQLFAALSGSAVFTKATTAAAKYSTAASGAGSATKDLLADWDELNIIQSENSGGGGGSGVAVGSMFEETGISDSIKNFAAEIRAAFDSKDWMELGSILGQKFNEIVQNIPWTSIGQTIGTSFTAAVQTAYSFLTTADFSKLGSGFASTVNNAISGMDTETLGRLLSRKLTAIWDFATGFLGDLDYVVLGQKIGDALSGAFNELGDWLKKQDWEAIGQNINNSLLEFVHGLGYSDMASAFFSLLGDAAVAAVSLIKGFVGPIWESIKGYFQPYIDEAGGNILLGIFNGVANGEIIDNVSSWIDINVIRPIDDAFERKFGVRPIASFIDGIKETAKPHIDGIVLLVHEAADWLGIDIEGILTDPIGTLETAWKTFSGWFKNKFGSWIATAAERIAGWIEDALGLEAGTVQKKWEAFCEWYKTTFPDGITGALSTIFEKITTFLFNPVGTIKRVWADFWETFRTEHPTLAEPLERIKESIKDCLEDPEGTVENLWNNFNSWFTNTFGVDVQTVMTTLLGFITDTFNLTHIRTEWALFKADLSTWLKTNVGTSVQELGDKFNKFLHDPVGSIEEVWLDFRNKMVGTWVPDVIKVLNSLLQTINDIINKLGENIGVTANLKINTFTGSSTTGTKSTFVEPSGGINVEKGSVADTLGKLATGNVGGALLNIGQGISQGVANLAVSASKAVDNLLFGGNFTKLANSILNKKAAGDALIPTGQMFVAREAGPELIGTMGNHSAVANNVQIIEGIRAGVAAGNDREVALLREQNDLLRQLLSKDTTVKITPSAALGRVTAQSTQMYQRVTG